MNPAVLYKRRGLIFLVSLVLLVACLLFLARKLSFETDFLKLVGREDVQAMAQQECLYILLSQPPTQDGQNLDMLVQALKQELKKDPQVATVQTEPDIPELNEMEAFLMTHKYLLLRPQRVKGLLAELASKDGLEKRLNHFLADLDNPFAPPLFSRDMLGIGREAVDALSQLDTGERHAAYVSRDGSMRLIVLTTRFAPQDVERNRRFIDGLRQGIARATANLPELSHTAIPGRGGYLLAGAHMFAYHDSRRIRRDVMVSLATTLVFITLFYLIVFRGVYPFAALGYLLLAGLAFTYSLAVLVYGPLNILVASFSAILLALGIDYLIHLLATFCQQQGTRLHKLSQTYKQAFSGILFGSLTTAGAFFSLYAVAFTMVRQLAVIIGIGILLMFAVIILCFPLFTRSAALARSLPVSAVFAYARKHRRSILLVFYICLAGVVLTIGIGGGNLVFDTDVQSLRPARDPAYHNLALILREFPIFSPHVVFVELIAPDPNGLLAKWHNCHKHFAGLQKNHAFTTIPPVVPDHMQQEQSIRLWQEMDMAALEQLTADIGAEKGISRAFVADYLADMRREIDRLQPIGLTDLQKSPALSRQFKRLVIPAASGWRMWLPLRFASDDGLQEFLARNQHGPYRLRGVPIIINTLARAVRNGFYRALVLAVALTLVLAFLSFRNAGFLLAVIPSFLAIATVLALMTLLGIPLNFGSILVLPLVFGIGIDDGIHFMHRFRLYKRMDQAFSQTALPIVMTSVTTMVGFGSLIFSSYKGLAQIGVLCLAGISAALLYTLFFLPLLILTFKKKEAPHV